MKTISTPDIISNEIKIAGKRTIKECRSHIEMFRGGGPDSMQSREWLTQLIKERFKTRFFTGMVPEEVLNGSHPRQVKGKRHPNGFAVMSIACLVIETLQAFQEGIACHKKDTGQLIIRFLQQESFWRHSIALKKIDCFLGEVRNGLLHRGETRRWTIQRRHAIAVDENHSPPVFGAWAFMACLWSALNSYIETLSELPADDELWQTALFKLEHGIIANAQGDPLDEGKKWMRDGKNAFRINKYLKQKRRAEERKRNELRKK